jgi:tetratricopeptide (TPR) repeat protein
MWVRERHAAMEEWLGLVCFLRCLGHLTAAGARRDKPISVNPIHWLVLAFCSVAMAVRPPPDYAHVLDTDLAKQVASLNKVHAFHEAVALAKRIETHVAPLPGVAYEAGFAHNQLGHIDQALTQYNLAIALDPHLATARYDRGEIYISLRRWTEARADFINVVAAEPEHWAGHFRLAHIAGATGESKAFERHLTEAIRHGLDLHSLAADPTWFGFAQDEVVGAAMRKVLVLYGSEALLREFGGTR